MNPSPPFGPSVWSATAPAGPETPPLAGEVSADVCVVGAGFAGLAAALRLAEAGAKVVVLEAREVGFGASGRNGGQVIPGLKFDPDALAARFPGESGERLIDFAGRTADAVFGLIERHGMDVPHVRAGWIQGAHAASSLKALEARAEQWRRRGADVVVLDKTAVDRALGANAYFGGWIDRRGGAVQPLSFVRALARAAQKAGAVIHGATPVTALAREGGRWRVSTGGASSVLAERVIVATNAYSGDLVPGLARSAVAVTSFQVATAPLSDNIRRSILPGGEVTSDSRKLLLYYRLDHEGRLLMGGRGPFRDPTSAADWAHLERAARSLFPQIGATPFEHRWSGRLAVTRDHLPHLHEPSPGLVVDIGCQGRGVGLQTAIGLALATFLSTGDARALPVPFTGIRPIPFHGLRKAYVAATVAFYRLADARK